MSRYGMVLAALLGSWSLAAEEPVDLKTLNRIKAEAFQDSQVMDHLFYLSDVYGPRLTNSPGHRAAAEWVVKRLESYGLQNVRLEKWGPFGQSWKLNHFSAHLLEPQYAPLIGFPLAWTPGTNGVVTGEPVLAPIHSEADFAKYRGKLKGKVVLAMDPKVVAMITQPLAKRWTPEELAARATVADPAHMGPMGPVAATAATPPIDREAAAKFKQATYQFLKGEGALVVLEYGYNGDGGTVFASSGGSRDQKDPVPPPVVALTPEHYNRIARLTAKNIPVKLEFDIRTEFLTGDTDSFNVVGEIPGGAKKDEIVMLGAHLDSWHGGTGATDNATGSSVAIEAVRILTALHLKMDRTVRIALWSGEEEGLLGSKAYVQTHFAVRDTMERKPEYEKLSAYYNDDTGTGRFRGISVGGNDMAKPIFEAWLAPLRDLEATTLAGTTAPPTKQPGGTDHTSFTWIGLPGFGFIQDPMEYQTRTHHSNMDLYDRVQPGDVMQGSAIMAWFVYNTATRAEMMPRLEPPKPLKAVSTGVNATN
ncbi:MAG: M20/M25/M40 family metallo-hydrolase [Acidobacteriaceae bacterium]|nr:M20/M25/M40 family metallo-hydrolase [Acidobacteriaceae bacterium]